MKLGAATENLVLASQSNIAKPAKNSTITQGNTEKAGSKPAGSARPSVAGSGVPVSVSALTRTLVQPSADADGDIDTKKVQDVRSAIANGSYKVNAGAIADKMLANAQELLVSRRN